MNVGGGGPGSSRSTGGIQFGSAWFQRRINLRPQHRGVHLVTEEVLRLIPEISQFSVGLAHIQSMCWVNFTCTSIMLILDCFFLSSFGSSSHICQFSSQRKLGS